MKIKSRKASAKRFRISATGKVKFKRAGTRHLMASKTSSYNLAKRGGGYMIDGDAQHVYECLPYGAK